MSPPAGYSSGYPGAPPTPYGVMPASVRTDSKAIVGLVLSISSWLLCPVILAVVALVLAAQSDREIAQSGGWVQGGTLNTATRWISWINIVFVVLLVVFGIVLVVVSLSTGSITLDDSTQF